MDARLLEQLSVITAEEQEILDGRRDIDRDIYMQGQKSTINSRKLLASGKLITIRPHTRFIHFPEHTHDYVEVVYMCCGETVHIVNGKTIRLREGELLFLGQRARHAVLKLDGPVAVRYPRGGEGRFISMSGVSGSAVIRPGRSPIRVQVTSASSSSEISSITPTRPYFTKNGVPASIL